MITALVAARKMVPRGEGMLCAPSVCWTLWSARAAGAKRNPEGWRYPVESSRGIGEAGTAASAGRSPENRQTENGPKCVIQNWTYGELVAYQATVVNDG
jgi:hypothetical protein